MAHSFESARSLILAQFRRVRRQAVHWPFWLLSQWRIGRRKLAQRLQRHSGSQLTLGERGEHAAARFLRRRGMKIVRRSARNRLGEIDLIAVDRRTVVFVEVKTRTSELRGDPALAVDTHKQQRLIRAATYFIAKHGLQAERTRFDVVAIVWPPQDANPRIKHYKNAFQPNGR